MATLMLEDLPQELLQQLQPVVPPLTIPSPPRNDSLDQVLSLCPCNASRISGLPQTRSERPLGLSFKLL